MKGMLRACHPHVKSLPLLGDRPLSEDAPVGNNRRMVGATPPKTIETTLARRLRTARLAAGLSQKKLAPLVGCSRGMIVALEQGRAEMASADLMIRIADSLGCSPRWLILGKGVQYGTGGIDDKEVQLIQVFRTLPDPMKEQIYGMAVTMAEAVASRGNAATPFPSAGKPPSQEERKHLWYHPPKK